MLGVEYLEQRVDVEPVSARVDLVDFQGFLDRDPGGFQIAGVVGLAVGQGDAVPGDFRVEDQAGLRVVVAGRHPQHGSFRIGQGTFRSGDAGQAQRQNERQNQRENLGECFHGFTSFYFCGRPRASAGKQNRYSLTPPTLVPLAKYFWMKG